MIFGKYSWILLTVCSIQMATYSNSSYGALITQDWVSKDKSKATITIKGGETLKLPKKGGGEVTLKCKGAVSCTVTLADFKDKKGNVTYDTNLTGLQSISGSINEGAGRFDITTTGNLEGLFSSSTATANLIASTGFDAEIGVLGDQLPQGGKISFGTRWFSNDVIGIDPVTFDEIILGNFFLDSIFPLTAFSYNIDPSANLFTTSFTIGQQYSFSTGLEITGEVTKTLHTVAEPSPAWLVGFGLLGFFLRSSRNIKPNKSI